MYNHVVLIITIHSFSLMPPDFKNRTQYVSTITCKPFAELLWKRRDDACTSCRRSVSLRLHMLFALSTGSAVVSFLLLWAIFVFSVSAKRHRSHSCKYHNSAANPEELTCFPSEQQPTHLQLPGLFLIIFSRCGVPSWRSLSFLGAVQRERKLWSPRNISTFRRSTDTRRKSER